MKKKPKRNESILIRLFCIALGFLLLAGIEGAARLFVDDSHLDQITEVLRQDPVLFWRNRSNLSTRFVGTDVYTNSAGVRIGKGYKRKFSPKLPGTNRIICLGASPTFGWGVEYEETYSQHLENLLRGEMGIRAEVINAGMIGHSSHQGKNILKNEWVSLDPDLITVSYVINDVDKYRFFRSNGKPDRELKPENRTVVWMRDAVDRSRIARLLERSIQFVVGGRDTFRGKPVEIYRPFEVRVPLDHYSSNLREIIDFAVKNGVKIVLVKMPINLPVAEELPEQKLERARELHSRGVRLVDEKNYGRAIELFRQAVDQNPYFSEAYYFLGVCYRHLDDLKKAEEAFDDAFESEAHRCGRDGKIYNNAMQEISEEKGIPLVDIVAAFTERKGEYLFVSEEADPIHPNAVGHKIIGRKIFETMTDN